MNIKEMMRLQGINPAKFVVDVSECTLGQQIGNAMSVNVIERVLNQALQAAGLTRKGCLREKLDPTRDRWANDEGFNEVRSPCRSVPQLNAAVKKDRLMWAPVGSAMSVRQRFREFLIDSGASYHLIGEETLSQNEQSRKYKLAEPAVLCTASGVVYAEWAIQVKVHSLGIDVECVILKDIPAVLSLGKLVLDEGYSFTWSAKELASLRKGRTRVFCHTVNNVPFIEQNASALVSHVSEVDSETLDEAFVTEASEDPQPKLGDSVASSVKDQVSFS